ncbi:ABC-type multidrug transport system, ATpase component [Clostridium aceticum]|uniref:ABC-type multidrug transport system, ATpase component n=1 Tax=Clostridium aceticum TaxID=84022 RepID=A0A0D8IB13_9CLOT|nr:ABC transporter ATP-binding protein [Clostridium aceticum]AKL96575.1 ABC-type multidrug transport system, ATpase component [Clostridium aceticum]KJF27269.1 ABC transporter [Clostridium aceticum]
MNLDVTFTNVSLKYKDFEALKDISFSLSQGKIYGLIGRNGAGKTTLLSLLASYQAPTSGKIKVGGEDPFENSKIMPHINFVYETDYGDEYEPVSAYFEFAERYRPNFDLDYAKELAALFKVPLDKPIKEFSSGMQSALNITLGLASRCAITIFDEVYLGMDAPSRQLFYKEVLEDQARYPRIMILSTHLVSEMEYLFDHVLILDHGSLLIDEAFDEIISRGASVTGNAKEVDAFVQYMNKLNTQQLGGTKSVMVYENIDDSIRLKAEKQGLEIGPVSLQELFIHLTEKEGSNESGK